MDEIDLLVVAPRFIRSVDDVDALRAFETINMSLIPPPPGKFNVVFWPTDQNSFVSITGVLLDGIEAGYGDTTHVEVYYGVPQY